MDTFETTENLSSSNKTNSQVEEKEERNSIFKSKSIGENISVNNQGDLLKDALIKERTESSKIDGSGDASSTIESPISPQNLELFEKILEVLQKS